uniref:Link domain-containing protein n=1 Tax=Labrus bergylta TaxID=56723 RepID=A0A3Q3FL20_9LABR
YFKFVYISVWKIYHLCQLLLQIDWEVFHVGSAEGFTLNEAASSCQEHNAVLASIGELYAAWKMGFDKCRAGWLADKSVRYPINSPCPECEAPPPFHQHIPC